MLLKSYLISIAVILYTFWFVPVPNVLSLNDKANVTLAYIYIGLSSLALLGGYALLYGIKKKKATIRIPESILNNVIPRQCMVILTLLSVSGLIISMLQIQLTVGLSEYFSLIANVNSSDVTNALRAATVTLSSSEGGLPGILKMFAENTVIAIFCVLVLIAKGYKLGGPLDCLLMLLMATMFLTGSFIRMDRLSLLSLMPILYYIFKKIRSRPKKILLMSLPILLIVLIIVQGSRRDSEIGLMGWLGLYVDSGVVNLNLLIHTLDHHTWGLRGIFSFVTWTFQGFGINIVPPVNYDIEWNPAQDGFGMMFMDFGWMGIIIFMFIGLICGYIDSQVPFSKLNEPWLEIQSILSFVFLSYWTVPAYDGIEFWLLLITSIALVKYIVKRANVTRSPRRTIKYRLFATTAK